jgi:hypothetical protein
MIRDTISFSVRQALSAVMAAMVLTVGISSATVMAAGLILLLVYFVWFAAQRRKSWPRWVLASDSRACAASPRHMPRSSARRL